MVRRVAPIVVMLGALALASCRSSSDAGPSPSASASSKASEAAKDHADVELSDEALEAAKLQIVKARQGARTASVVVSGTLDFNPQRTAKIGPLLDGRVLAVRVKQGDEVAAGAGLATITSIDVGRARADHMAAQARLQQADAALTREKKLLESRATSEREIAERETAKSLAEVEVRAAAERLRASGAGPGGTGASLTLNTPIAGHVIEAEARIGQAVRATDTLFVVGDTSELWLIGDLYERDLSRVKVGDAVKVSVTAIPGRVFDGKVDHVHERIDPGRRATDVRVVLSNGDGALIAGMSATARILSTRPVAQGEANEPAIVVPRGAIQNIDGQPFVFVEQGHGKFEMRAVVKGADLEGDVEIKRGVADGEPVVADGSFILKSHVLREQMGSNDLLTSENLYLATHTEASFSP
ncbi:MAG: efflux RND transporter periplasmic adaptor subunit [Polyangiaceae bacterium]